MDKETWKVIPFATDYEVSDHGRVRRATLRERCRIGLLKPCGAGRDREYQYVGLTFDNGVRKSLGVHVLVLTAFRGEKPTPRHESAHLDGNRRNNHLNNLEWKLPRANAADRILHGTQTRGTRYGLHKLTDESVKQILVATGSQREVGKRFGVSQSMVHRIRAGKAWCHVSL